MHYPLAIFYTPLPQGSIQEIRIWRCAFDAALAPWLDARQQEHVRRFGRTTYDPKAAGQEIAEAALSRLIARAQLITAAAPLRAGAAQFQIGMDNRGRPQLDGWRAAFSHSGQAAFCALAPAGKDSPALGLDAEALTSPPPHASAFAAHEIAARPCAAGPSRRQCSKRRALALACSQPIYPRAGLGKGLACGKGRLARLAGAALPVPVTGCAWRLRGIFHL